MRDRMITSLVSSGENNVKLQETLELYWNWHAWYRSKWFFVYNLITQIKHNFNLQTLSLISMRKTCPTMTVMLSSKFFADEVKISSTYNTSTTLMEINSHQLSFGWNMCIELEWNGVMWHWKLRTSCCYYHGDRILISVRFTPVSVLPRSTLYLSRIHFCISLNFLIIHLF